MNDRKALDLSDGLLDYRLDLSGGIAVEAFGLKREQGGGAMENAGDAGVTLTGLDFAVYADGMRIDGGTEGLACIGAEQASEPSGARHAAVTLRHAASELEIVSHLVRFEGTPLVEKWIEVCNAGDRPITVERLDSFLLRIPAGEWNMHSYKSDWGAEFEPQSQSLDGSALTLQTRYGRSSKGSHPWMGLQRADGEALAISPMWSGNWIIRCEPDGDDGSYAVSGGLNDWEFFKTLEPGERMEAVHVAICPGRGDWNGISVMFGRVGRRYWYPHNEFSRSLPAEWNHWWSYEDKLVNERNFRENATEAARLGLDICTLDAGWFGPSEPGADWYQCRGDWELVNRVRFPAGIRALSDEVHALGMKFGLWCEIEAVGVQADIARRHPAFVARRDGQSRGYLCFGNPDVQDWAFDTLDRLIGEYRSDWIKLDFNLDPEAGCNCIDHGHGAGDGLYEHYNGYYRVLERIRGKHPQVILENCSSGGLRIDLGMMRRTHTTFLSDPDWPEHSLQAFWGATTMLAPDVCLHWSYSDWLGEHPSQRFDPRDPQLQPHQFDYYTRIAMLRGFGLSQKLPELPEWIRERLAGHIGLYRSTVRTFVRDADLYRLTEQPLRGGRGDRWAAFQYSMPEGDDHLLFVFRLDGGEAARGIALQALRPDGLYELEWLSGDRREKYSGRELMEGALRFAGLEEEDSAIMRLRRI